MIQLSNEYKRNLLFPNTNKALLEILKNASPEQLVQLKETKDLKSIMSSLFQEKMTGSKSDQILLDILKNSPLFKNMGNFTDELKTLVKELKAVPELSTGALERFIKNSSSLSSQNLQTQIANSGIFMESKLAAFLEQPNEPLILPNLQETKAALSTLYQTLLTSSAPEVQKLLDGIEKLLSNLSKAPQSELKSFIQNLDHAIAKGDIAPEHSKILPKLIAFLNPKELLHQDPIHILMADDVKSNLMHLAKELQQSTSPSASHQLEQIDKLLLQIDYHQLQSHLSHSTSLYIPFQWDQLEEGSLQFKKKSPKKFYCAINLKLKEYGQLDLMMALYEENQLDIQIQTEKQSLKDLIQSHLGELKALLSKSGLIPKSIRLTQADQPSRYLHDAYTSDGLDPYTGFEVKV